LRILDNSGRRAPLVAAVLLAGCLLAACGSSSSSTTTTSSPSTSAAAASPGGSSASARRASLRSCLKAHGVTLPSRPAGGGGPPPGSGGGPGFFGGGGGAGGGGLANNPKVRAAFQACGGGNFRGGGRRLQLSHAAITSYVSCVRQHGYNMPSPNFSGKGAVFPASIRTNPKFQAASKSCQSLLFPRRGAGTGTTTGPTA
jgi:hypothetical protein